MLLKMVEEILTRICRGSSINHEWPKGMSGLLLDRLQMRVRMTYFHCYTQYLS